MATSTLVVSLPAFKNHPAITLIVMFKNTLTIRDVFEEVLEAEIDTSDIDVEREDRIGSVPGADC